MLLPPAAALARCGGSALRPCTRLLRSYGARGTGACPAQHAPASKPPPCRLRNTWHLGRPRLGSCAMPLLSLGTSISTDSHATREHLSVHIPVRGTQRLTMRRKPLVNAPALKCGAMRLPFVGRPRANSVAPPLHPLRVRPWPAFVRGTTRTRTEHGASDAVLPFDNGNFRGTQRSASATAD